MLPDAFKKSLWKRAIFIFSTLLIFNCAENPSIAHLRPAISHKKKSPSREKTNQAFIRNAILKYGSHEAASQQYVEEGWHKFYQKDYAISMKRFNQAWLLDSLNGNVYWGFASILGNTGSSMDTVIHYFQWAQKLLPQDERLKGNLANAYGFLAEQQQKNHQENYRLKYDTAFTLFMSLKTRKRTDADLYLQYWGIALKARDEKQVIQAQMIIDSTGIVPENQAWLDTLKAESKKRFRD